MTDIDVKYLDPFSLLLIDKTGSMRRIFCPFKVKGVLATTGNDKISVVEMVRIRPPDEIIYVIEGKDISHHDFEIT